MKILYVNIYDKFYNYIAFLFYFFIVFRIARSHQNWWTILELKWLQILSIIHRSFQYYQQYVIQMIPTLLISDASNPYPGFSWRFSMLTITIGTTVTVMLSSLVRFRNLSFLFLQIYFVVCWNPECFLIASIDSYVRYSVFQFWGQMLVRT